MPHCCPTSPVAVCTAHGIQNGASRPMQAVRATDSATSPRARWLNRLEVAPPGAAATSSRPIARAPCSLNRTISNQASAGNSSNWASRPLSAALGLCQSGLKCPGSRPLPTTSIISARHSGSRMVLIGIVFPYAASRACTSRIRLKPLLTSTLQPTIAGNRGAMWPGVGARRTARACR